MENWVPEHWFDLVETIGVVGSLLFAAISFRADTKTRRISNLLVMTANYRELWREFLHSPDLSRIMDRTANISEQPITPAEEIFVNIVISQTSSMYETLKDALVIKQDELRRDVNSFFSLPVPKAVWAKTKRLQNRDFAAFIESSLGENP